MYIGKPIKKLKVDLYRADSALDYNDDLADLLASKSDLLSSFLRTADSQKQVAACKKDERLELKKMQSSDPIPNK